MCSREPPVDPRRAGGVLHHERPQPVTGILQFSRLVGPAECKRPDRLEQPESARVGVAHEEALGDQIHEGRQHRSRTLGACHGVSRSQVEARRKRAELSQQVLRLPVEQVVAPRNRAIEGHMALATARPAGAREVQALVYPFQQVVEPECAQLGRGEFDCQRKAIEVTADIDHPRVVDAYLELRSERTCPGHEQLRSIGVQRRQRQNRLTIDAERFSRGHEHVGLRAPVEHQVHEVTALIEQVLAVVEHEQHRSARQVLGQAFLVHRCNTLDPGGLRNRLGETRGVTHRRQLDKGDSRRERRQFRVRRSECQRRLARTAGAGDRHEPTLCGQIRDPLELCISADQFGPQQRWRSRDRTGQRREGCAAELPEPHGGHRRIDETDPQVDEVIAIGQELRGDIGQQRLAAVGRCGDPGGPIDGRSQVVAVSFQRLTRVESEAYPDRHRSGPPFCVQCPADLFGRPDRIGRSTERSRHPVSPCGEDGPPVDLDGAPKQFVVARDGQCHLLRMLLPHRG